MFLRFMGTRAQVFGFRGYEGPGSWDSWVREPRFLRLVGMRAHVSIIDVYESPLLRAAQVR